MPFEVNVTHSAIGCVPEHKVSGPADDEAGQEALGDGLQHGAGKHVDPQLRPPGHTKHNFSTQVC